MSANGIFDPDIFDPVIFDTEVHNFFAEINESTISVSDSISAALLKTRTISEFTDLNFALNFQANYFRILSENVIILDIVNIVRNVSSFLNENVSVIDAVNRLVNYFRNILEPGGGMFDDSIFDPAIFDTELGAIPISDQLDRQTDSFISISENTTVLDSLSRKINQFRTIIENVSINDAIARLTQHFRSISQNVSISDVISLTAMNSVVISDVPIIINDTLNIKTDLKRQINESVITIFDTLSRIRDSAKSIIENVSVNDVLSFSFTGSITINEIAITIGESLTSQTIKTKEIIESVIISDILESAKFIEKLLTESAIFINDSLVFVASKVIGIIENVNVVDSISRKLASFRTIMENVLIFDAVFVINTGVISTKTDTSNLCLQTEDESDLCM